MTAEEFLLELYGAMLRAGISLEQADGTDLKFYLKILMQQGRGETRQSAKRGPEKDAEGHTIIWARRGFVDDVMG